MLLGNIRKDFMKKIAVITMGIRLNNEKGYTRFRFLCEFLVQNGFEVDLITTSFQHWEKAHRDINSIKKDEYSFGVHFIDEPGYKKNLDARRIYSHHVASKNLKKLLEKGGNYDLIYCEIPPNDVALEAAKYAKKKGIPFVPDVNDLWPEAMRMVIDIPILSDILFYPFLRDAEKVYRLSSAIVGTSDEYSERPFIYSKKKIPRETVYVGNEINVFDAGVKKYSESIKKGKEFWVTYAGTIGTSYDIQTLILAADYLKTQGYDNIYFKILGGGPLKEKLEKQARELKGQVEFVGYVPYEEMAAYLNKSEILVNSFVKKAPQSIVTKIGDYLAAGRPMINTCSSLEFRRKVEDEGFGINIEAENPNILAEAIVSIYNNKKWQEEMGRKARKVAEEQFDRPISYKRIVDLINRLLGENEK